MKFARRLQPSANASFVPMVDVVFQLVIFFMVSSTFVVAPGIKLDLPRSSSSEAIKMTPLVVSIYSADRIYVNQTLYNLSGFRNAISTLPKDKAEARSIVVEGDRSISYETMIQVLDVLRVNGIRGVSLRTLPATGSTQ